MLKQFLAAFLFISFSFSFPQNFTFELTDIQFDGNENFSDAELKDIIYSEETPFWLYKFVNSFTSFGKPPIYLDSSNIQIDLNSLKDFYNNNGFFQANFSYELFFDTTANEASILFKINENSPTFFHSISAEGISKLPENLIANINELFLIDTELRFNQQDVLLRIDKTGQLLRNNGYMQFSYDSTLTKVDTTLNEAYVTVYFSPGTRFKIDEILVSIQGEGREEVNPELLKELTGIKNGDYFSDEKIKRAQNRLFRTELFSSINIVPDDSTINADSVSLSLNGTIGYLNELSPEIILNDELGELNLGLGAKYIKKNFFGGGRKITLGAELAIIDFINLNYSKLFTDFGTLPPGFSGYLFSNIRIEQPYLFGQNIIGSIEAYDKYYLLTLDELNLLGSKLEFEFELPNHTFINRLKLFQNLENIFLLIDEGGIYDPDLEGIQLDARTFTVSVGAEIASVSVNDLLFPSRGNNLIAFFEVGRTSSRYRFGGPTLDLLLDLGLIDSRDEFDIIGTPLFYKTKFTSLNYFSLNKDFTSVFALKFETGYIQAFEGGIELLPFNKTFLAGGSNSVRGWRARELIPAESDEFIDLSVDEQPRGGTFLLEGSFEFRYKFVDFLGVAIFTDYGNTWNGYGNFNFDEVAVASGIGFRYYSPIAPFRIDFAFKVYDPFDKSYITYKNMLNRLQIHFGIGEAF